MKIAIVRTSRRGPLPGKIVAPTACGQRILPRSKTGVSPLGHAADVARELRVRAQPVPHQGGEAKGAGQGLTSTTRAGSRSTFRTTGRSICPTTRTAIRSCSTTAITRSARTIRRTAFGWYRKTFDLPAAYDGRRISIEFDGVFRDSSVFLNGHYLGRHASGYTPFRYDVTGRRELRRRERPGRARRREPVRGVVVRRGGNYRHVWLVKTEPQHVAPNGTFVTTKVGKTGARRHRSHNDRERQRRAVQAQRVVERCP
jgi:hypothetical protein